MLNRRDNPLEILRDALEGGAHGMTLREGKAMVVHWAPGPQRVDEVVPTREDLLSVLDQMISTRQKRRLRDGRGICFTYTLESAIPVLGGASITEYGLRLELRRMVDQPAASPDAESRR